MTFLAKTVSIITLIAFFHLQCVSQQAVSKDYYDPLKDIDWVNPIDYGFEQAKLDYLDSLIYTTKFPDYRGLVVFKDHKLVIDYYYNSFGRETIHDIRSAGKSITAILMGIAIDKGFVKSVEDKVVDYMPQNIITSQQKKELGEIKIKHLLMMSSGMDSDTDDSSSKGFVGKWIGRKTWMPYTLSVPMEYEPGSKWVYNDICAMWTGAIIQEQTGMLLSEFADKYLFGPLNIKEWYWYTGGEGITGGMGNLYITTLDFAKLGELILRRGDWNGKQVVSSTWIDEMSTPRLDISDTGIAKSYGYLWYIDEIKYQDQVLTYFGASGNGGNRLFVVPELDLVVACTSSAYMQDYGHGRAEFIFDYLIKALE